MKFIKLTAFSTGLEMRFAESAIRQYFREHGYTYTTICVGEGYYQYNVVETAEEIDSLLDVVGAQK